MKPGMKALLIVAVVLAMVGIGVYQFGFQKIEIEPGSVSAEELNKACQDESFRKDSAMTEAQAAQMKIACECMMAARAEELNRKDGVTVIEWMTEVHQKTTACMAEAGISTQ